MKRNHMKRIVSALLVLMLLFAAPAFASGNAAVVKASKPTSVTLSITTKTVIPGEALQLSATVAPEGASQSVSWKSSNTSIATVSSSGLVMAKRKGAVKITATTKTGSKKASCVVTVSQTFAGVNVHFYGIGNENYYDEVLRGCLEDLASMANVYRSASYGGKRPSVYTHPDQTGAGMRNVLQSMVSNPDIDEDDITIFYYSGHGLEATAQQPEYQGALVGVDFNGYTNQVLSVNEAQTYLDKVKGHVVVIIDSCFSGQFIKNKGATAVAQSREASMRAANAAWVNQLSTSRATNFNTKALTNSLYRTKYRIITAASNAQESVSLYEEDEDGNIIDSFGLFTYAFTGYLEEMGADANKDEIVNLHEVYTKTYKWIESFRKGWNKEYPRDKLYQVTQVWPSKNGFPIYARN